jgi:hypothetical protein
MMISVPFLCSKAEVHAGRRRLLKVDAVTPGHETIIALLHVGR